MGGSWEAAVSGEPGHQGVRACVARCCLPCVREGAREGQAQPCHAGCQLQGRRGGRRNLSQMVGVNACLMLMEMIELLMMQKREGAPRG